MNTATIRTPRFFSLFLYVIASLFPFCSRAQVQTGTPPFGSFGGGPDVINLGNLNAHLTIPVLHKPGRGLHFSFYLAYDTSVWTPMTSSGTTSWQPAGAWGWSSSAFKIGYITNNVTIRYSTCYDQHHLPHTQTTWTYSGWTYVDAFGTLHQFWGSSYHWIGCTFGSSGFTAAPARDDSGYSLTATGGAATLYGADGALINAPINNTGGSGSAQDRNGNEISYNGGTGIFTDTLGTTALTRAGAAPNPVTYTYTAPSGASASFTVKFTTYSIQTNFGCSNISEFGTNGTTTANLVTEIDLPDGTKYSFAYEPTPGLSGFVTGRLASVTLPAGGSITHTYTAGNLTGSAVGNNDPIVCADGSAAGLQRAIYDGANTNTWAYARTQVSGNHWQTKVTTPPDSQNQGSVGDDSVIDFQKDSSSVSNNFFETQRQAYQGSFSSGTLLRTTTICYNANTSSCATTAVSSPITQRNATDILPGGANLQCMHLYKYGSSGSLTEQDDYDYAPGGYGALLKKTAITYASLGSITKFRQTVTVTNGSGATVSETNYNYDETAVVATSGTPQHTSVSGSRGNLTSINYYTAGSTYLTKKMSYFDTGNVQTVTDVNGAQTTYTYGACGNSFPTSVSEPLSLSKSMTWNCTGGVQLTSTDESNETTTTTYNDPYFWRPASTTDPTSAAANLTYTGETQIETSMAFNNGNSTSDALSIADGLGRPMLLQKRQAPGSANFDSVETAYDTFGRLYWTCLPYSGTAGQTNPSCPSINNQYDALGRKTWIGFAPGGGSRTFSYSQNDVYVTRGPAPSGENTKRRQEEFDALGRLTSVCEVTSATGSGTCGQNTFQTGYWTKYAYDALGRLTGVTQNAQGTAQTRTYVYDLLGRLTSTSNPENGTTTYVYDTDSTCGTSSGDLVKKTDAAANVTCAVYDALHRPTSVTYPSGPNSSSSVMKVFYYDTSHFNTTYNTKGRLASAGTCANPTCAGPWITAEDFSYSPRGEVTDLYEWTTNSGGWYHTTQSYWANGSPNQLTAPGIPTITFTPDGEGRPYKVSASSGQNPVTNTVFNAASLPTSITYGSADSDAFTYDSNTNRVTQYQFNVNGQSLTGALTWNANHTLASQNVTDPFNSADTQNCTYTDDDLTRLASVNCGSIFSQTFGYDAFGNISKSGTYTFQPTYDSATNHFSSVPGCSALSYDSNGNVLNDCNHTYTWDSVGKAVTVDSVSLTFDALGRMVEQNRSGTYTQIVYSPGGAKLALMNGQTLQKGLVALPGGGQAVYNSSGLLYYGHSDHLGSTKLGSTTSRTVYFDLAYAPFGELYATSGTTDPAFTGQRQDTVSGLYDFPARQYSTQGRWPNPDPSGLASVTLSDPQTLNRYAYVRNNPLVMIDPYGLYEVDDCGDSFDDGEGDCGGGGGGGACDASVDPSCGDPTSGGAPGNSGSNCDPTDPSCGGPIDDSGNPPVGSPGDVPLVDNTDPSTLSQMGLTDSNGSNLPFLTNATSIANVLFPNGEPALGTELPTFADQQLQAISPTLATASDLVEIAGWVTLAEPVTVGCIAMGAVSCASAGMAGVFMLNELFGEENQLGPPNQHIPGNEPGEGPLRRAPGSINGEPPVDILVNTMFPIIIF